MTCIHIVRDGEAEGGIEGWHRGRSGEGGTEGWIEEGVGRGGRGGRERWREGKGEGMNWEDKQQTRENTFLNILSIHPRSLSSVLISRF